MITRFRSFLVLVILLALVAGGSVAPRATQAQSQPASALAADEPSVQALAGVSLSPARVTVPVLSTFALDVLVDCGTQADAAGIEVTFNPAYMEVVSVTQDVSAFSDVLRSQFDNVAGVVKYDAGSVLCHGQGSCPAGVIRVATITFHAKAPTFPTRNVSIYGQVTWTGNLTFDGQGTGSTITITSPISPVYLPFVSRGWMR